MRTVNAKQAMEFFSRHDISPEAVVTWLAPLKDRYTYTVQDDVIEETILITRKTRNRLWSAIREERKRRSSHAG